MFDAAGHLIPAKSRVAAPLTGMRPVRNGCVSRYNDNSPGGNDDQS